MFNPACTLVYNHKNKCNHIIFFYDKSIFYNMKGFVAEDKMHVIKKHYFTTSIQRKLTPQKKYDEIW